MTLDIGSEGAPSGVPDPLVPPGAAGFPIDGVSIGGNGVHAVPALELREALAPNSVSDASPLDDTVTIKAALIDTAVHPSLDRATLTAAVTNGAHATAAEIIDEERGARLTSPLDRVNGTTNGHVIDMALRPEAAQAVTAAAPNLGKESLRELGRSFFKELNAAGIPTGAVVFEALRGTAASCLRWAGTYALFNVAVESFVSHSPMVLAYAAVWGITNYLAARMERTGDNRSMELGRRFENYLSLELLRKHGSSTFAQLKDPKYRAEKELQQERAEDVGGMIDSVIEMPGTIMPVALSLWVLLSSSNWSTALVIGVAIATAVTPLIRANCRQAREDLELEERQACKSNVVATVNDEVYSTLGASRMIIGQMTGRVTEIMRRHQDEIDRETTAHERKQLNDLRWPDRVFYMSVLSGMLAVGYRVFTGGIELGDAIFSMKLLTEMGEEFEEHGKTVEGYRTQVEKYRRFHAFMAAERSVGTLALPDEPSLHFAEASFTRGCSGSEFTACLPDCSPQPGDLIIIHGASGAGKTTLVKHLAYACQPGTGEVSVGGVPLEALDPEAWFGAIRYCAATPSLQEGLTVRQALTLDPLGDEFFEKRIAHPLIRDLIIDLQANANGLDTVIGEGLPLGREFSTGELHRLALVMALVPEPKILFLDEVSSNQSDDFVRVLVQAIQDARDAKTIIIFATHSKQFDDSATHIVKISRGQSELLPPADPPSPDNDKAESKEKGDSKEKDQAPAAKEKAAK